MRISEIKVNNLIDTDIGSQHDYGIIELIPTDIEHDDPQIKGFCTFHLRFLKEKNSLVAIISHLSAEVKTFCNRCMQEIEENIQIEEFHESYILRISDEEENEDEPLYKVDMKHMCIDLSEVIRNNILLSQDMFILCKKECKGLCAECGKDKNKKLCTCENEDIKIPLESDTYKPFSILKEYKNEKQL